MNDINNLQWITFEEFDKIINGRSERWTNEPTKSTILKSGRILSIFWVIEYRFSGEHDLGVYCKTYHLFKVDGDNVEVAMDIDIAQFGVDYGREKET